MWKDYIRRSRLHMHIEWIIILRNSAQHLVLYVVIGVIFGLLSGCKYMNFLDSHHL